MNNNFFGTNFISKTGPVEIKLQEVQIVVLYFAAGWCPPCQIFTSKLVDFYNDVNLESKILEIIYVSYDNDEQKFKEFQAQMPWPAFPFKDERIKQVIEKYKIKSIPTVTVLKQNGDVAIQNGRKDVQQFGEEAFNKWVETIKQQQEQ